MSMKATPPRSPEDVVAAARNDKELMRQLEESLEAEQRGDFGTPLKELQAQRQAAHTP
jgi:hypothetical protein